jgi:hypothetical protein
MAARDISGTPRTFTAEGETFRLAGDANITETFTEFENEMIASSGTAMRKMTKRIPMREGIVLLTNADERETLKVFAEQLDDLKISYTNAAGDRYKCEGAIEIENNETEDNRTTLQVHPRGQWTPFIG